MTEYWYCLEHHAVEEGRGCANMGRLGPYRDRDEAADAPRRAAERTAENDAQDALDDDWGRR